MRWVVTLTLLTGVWALWVRRYTWRIPWEKPATFNIALQTVDVLLVSAPVSRWLSPRLYALTGQWNLEELIGHLAYMTGMSAVLYMTVSRLNMTDRQFAHFVRHRIELPATVFVPAVIAVFLFGGLGAQHVPDLALEEQTRWLNIYWLLYVAGLAYLLAQIAQALLILRTDPVQTRVANLYLVAVGVSALCAVAFLTGFTDPLGWLLIRAEVVCYAIAASYSWQSKVSYLRGGGPIR